MPARDHRNTGRRCARQGPLDLLEERPWVDSFGLALQLDFFDSKATINAAAAAYSTDGYRCDQAALQMLEAKDGRIRVIDHFMNASSHAAFFADGLARTLTATPG